MGWRYYVYKMKKEDTNKFRKANIRRLKKNGFAEDGDEYGNGIYIKWRKFPMEALYEFGKYVDFVEDIDKMGKPLFKNKKIQNELIEYGFTITGREGLKLCIDFYTKQVVKYFRKLLTGDTKEIVKDISDKLNRWDNKYGCLPYDMYLENEQVTSSWLYEYSIFELVRLYKSIDFKTYDLIFFGW